MPVRSTLAFTRSLGALLRVALLALPTSLLAQPGTGRITGRVLDAVTGAGLSDVGVQIVGTTTGAMSGVNGRYTLTHVSAGTVTIHVRRIGFQPKTVTGILLAAGEAIELNVALVPAAVTLTTQVVTAAAERGTVNAALDEQRTATGIVNAITSEQISRSPDSDAAQAVQRVSGVTVQDGKYIFVRGLGERYTTTSLNGARIPSPEPDRKIVPLDLFPSGLLQTITTTKTFTPDLPGDFSGAQVDLRTREFPSRRQVAYSASIGYNDAATGQTVLGAPGETPDAFAMGSGDRELPSGLRPGQNLGQLSQADENRIVRSFRNVWSADRVDGAPNGSFSVSLGGHDPIFGRRIGYLGSLTYSYNQEVRDGEEYANIVGTTDGPASVLNQFRGATGRTSVLWGGMLNLSTLVGRSSRLFANNTYSRAADNEARRDSGFYEGLAAHIDRTTLRYVERSVRSNQIGGEHTLGTRHALDWAVTSSGVTRDEPDRSDLVYIREGTGPSRLFIDSPDGARRLFTGLDENSWEGSANYKLSFGGNHLPHAIRLGGLARRTHRDAQNLAYGIYTVGAKIPPSELEQSPEEVFGGTYTSGDQDVFTLFDLGAGGSYTADDNLFAGYAMLEYALSQRLKAIAGARVEYSDVRVFAAPTAGRPVVSSPDYLDVLPSLVLNYSLSEFQHLRFSVSQTLSRPEYRELAPILFRDVLGGINVQGNATLRRTLIQNADARWEWYPNPGEVVSLGVFAKKFRDPIEKVERGTSGANTATYVNAAGAENYGVELELRKGLGMFSEALESFFVFANATLMESDIRPENEELVNLTSGNRAMVGQAPYVVNAGLSYGSGSGNVSATLLYNVVGERIVFAGASPTPDAVEQPRRLLDLSLRVPLFRDVSAKLDAKNLLDPPFEVHQGGLVRERFTTGRVYSVGLSWRP